MSWGYQRPIARIERVVMDYSMNVHTSSKHSDADNQENVEVATTDKAESNEGNIEMTPNTIM